MIPRHSLLGSAVGGGGWSLATSGSRPRVRFPSTRGWGTLVVVVCGRSPFLAKGPGCGSPPLLAGVRRLRWAVSSGGGCPMLCVFVVRAVARGARAFVCFVCVWCLCWWWCCVGVSSACAGVRACLCVVCWWSFVACSCLSRLRLAAGVCVGVVGVCCGWSLATPG